jgi:hypothetical protein
LELVQSVSFIAILILVTLRTLALRRFANSVNPDTTSLVIGLGTALVCGAFLPFAIQSGVVSSLSLDCVGIAAGIAKGMLLTLLLVAQQQLIGRSLSAITYVFPIAVGAIAIVEAVVFGTSISRSGFYAIGLLFTAGIGFTIFGHLGAMSWSDKGRFALMVIMVVGFAVCDKIGIPRSGWYLYLLYTGLGNFASSIILFRRFPMIDIWPWFCIAITWVIPELFFNFAIADILPVSYGYLAISLRVPVLMILAVLFYREGHMSTQLAFGVISLMGTIPLFFR